MSRGTSTSCDVFGTDPAIESRNQIRFSETCQGHSNGKREVDSISGLSTRRKRRKR